MAPLHARRLLYVWFVSTLVLTLAPFALRATPRAWSDFSRLGSFDLLAAGGVTVVCARLW